jgi:hypothetical protein
MKNRYLIILVYFWLNNENQIYKSSENLKKFHHFWRLKTTKINSFFLFEILILIYFLDEILLYSVEIFTRYLLNPVATSHTGYHTIANDWAGQFPIARSSGWLSRRVAWKSGFGLTYLRLWKDETLPLGFFTFLLPSTHKRLLVISFTAFTVGRSCTSPL